MPDAPTGRRLRSLDEFEKPVWSSDPPAILPLDADRERAAARFQVGPISIPAILLMAAAGATGAFIGLSWPI
ncbi:MAG: hypothetical protein DI605_12300 [Sphingomonas sp.]|nr:MAG: hypothetical protein DI605_12300 [Sphingomonas sp.]